MTTPRFPVQPWQLGGSRRLATVPTTNGQPAMVAWSEASRTGALSAITLDWLGTKLTGPPCGQVAWVAEVSR